MDEAMTFGPVTVRFDDQVLRPRPWTLAQSIWASHLSDKVPDGAILELCAGAGQIGLALASLVSRDLVLVDVDQHACEHARANALTASLPTRVDIRCGPMRAGLDEDEEFALILADPPWVPSGQVARYPNDPPRAIDGGPDGLDLARACTDVIARHLGDGGAAILQLASSEQSTKLASYLGFRPQLGLAVREARAPRDSGVLVRLARREKR